VTTFEARYPGRCGVCDERIRPGDQAMYVDDEIAHAACPAPVALAEPCPRCFMVPATNGACDCEDSR
jgi:hypothetical protein